MREALGWDVTAPKMSELGWRLVSQAPEVGQHNNEIYCGELGLSEDELQESINAGII